jgi:hypothetical protein
MLREGCYVTFMDCHLVGYFMDGGMILPSCPLRDGLQYLNEDCTFNPNYPQTQIRNPYPRSPLYLQAEWVLLNTGTESVYYSNLE